MSSEPPTLWGHQDSGRFASFYGVPRIRSVGLHAVIKKSAAGFDDSFSAAATGPAPTPPLGLSAADRPPLNRKGGGWLYPPAPFIHPLRSS